MTALGGKSRRFAIAAATLLLVNAVLIALYGREVQLNPVWLGLNLPGLACGVCTAFLGIGETEREQIQWWAHVSLAVTSVVSSLFWASLLSRLTLRRAKRVSRMAPDEVAHGAQKQSSEQHQQEINKWTRRK